MTSYLIELGTQKSS